MQKVKQQGFTIVELLIVIVVIGILAALVITTYTGIQAKARNSERQTDINSLQTQFEAYFAEHGNYPTRTDVNDEDWRADEMKSLDAGALKDPQGTPGLVEDAAAKVYAYDVTNSSGASCEADEATCAEYTLTATLEGGSTYVKSNLD